MDTITLVIGAYRFGLHRREDGTYQSICLGLVTAEDVKPKQDEVIHLSIPSHTDPNKDYDVDVYPNGLIHCNCTGWGFRHHCSHCDDAKYILYGGSISSESEEQT